MAYEVEWHKIVALIMGQLGIDNVVITAETIKKFVVESEDSVARVGRPATTVVAREIEGGVGLHIILMPYAQAEMLSASQRNGSLH